MGAKGHPDLNSLRGQPAILVASTGGHLEQATRWAIRLGLSPDSLFITFDSQQSRELMSDRKHQFVPYIAPRDIGSMITAIPILWRAVRAQPNMRVLSTGAGIAIPTYIVCLISRRPLYYIESVSRFVGPSLTGRLLSRLPRVFPYAQHRGYPAHWKSIDSLLAHYQTVPHKEVVNRPLKYFVTLGTIRPYRFDALVDAVLQGLDDDDQIVWQLGETTRRDLPGISHSVVSPADFELYAREADVVITHAGVGSVLRLLDCGISPIVVPRSPQRKEHVDDHQRQVASALSRSGLAGNFDPRELTHGVLHCPRPRINKL